MSSHCILCLENMIFRFTKIFSERGSHPLSSGSFTLYTFIYSYIERVNNTVVDQFKYNLCGTTFDVYIKN